MPITDLSKVPADALAMELRRRRLSQAELAGCIKESAALVGIDALHKIELSLNEVHRG